MGTGEAELPARGLRVQGEEMLQAEEVAAMVRLHELGWGAKRLSKEFGCARNTVRRYLRAGGPAPFIAAALFAAYQSGYAIAFYILGCGIISIVAAALLTDYTNKDIS